MYVGDIFINNVARDNSGQELSLDAHHVNFICIQCSYVKKWWVDLVIKGFISFLNFQLN